MRCIVVRALLVALLLLLVTACRKQATDPSLRRLQERGELVVGMDDSFPPLGFCDENGDLVGVGVDLAREVALRLGVTLRTLPIAWGAGERALTDGTVDCIWNVRALIDECTSSATLTKPYLAGAQVILVRAESGITSWQGLSGRLIGVQTGSSAARALERAADFTDCLRGIIEFGESGTALDALTVGGVDGVVVDSLFAGYELARSGRAFSVVEDSGLVAESYAVAFYSENRTLMDAVQRLLDELSADGTVARIFATWLGNGA